MDINYYLGIDTTHSQKIKNLYVLDFKTKRMYNGIIIIGDSYEYLAFSDSKKIPKRFFDYLFPIYDPKILSKIMKCTFRKVYNEKLNDFIIKFGLIEWLI